MDSMNNSALSAALDEIINAYKRPEKAHFTVRLCDRELAVLKRTAKGRSASAALEQIIAAYMQSEKRPQHRDKSVKKVSFIINAALLEEVHEMANETRATASEIIHAALREANAGTHG
jgi:metal-responsive CopG/Arc/MetJ family transcriptional regulator